MGKYPPLAVDYTTKLYKIFLDGTHYIDHEPFLTSVDKIGCSHKYAEVVPIRHLDITNVFW